MEQALTAENYRLPEEPNAAVNIILATIDTLSAVYARENEALQNADTRSFFEIQEEKLKTARIYEFRVRELLSRKDDIKKVDPDLQTKLKETQGKFSKLAEENVESLSRMQKSVNRLGDKIRNAAKETAKKDRVYNYGETGRVQEEHNKPISSGLSETA